MLHSTNLSLLTSKYFCTSGTCGKKHALNIIWIVFFTNFPNTSMSISDTILKHKLYTEILDNWGQHADFQSFQDCMSALYTPVAWYHKAILDCSFASHERYWFLNWLFCLKNTVILLTLYMKKVLCPSLCIPPLGTWSNSYNYPYCQVL